MRITAELRKDRKDPQGRHPIRLRAEDHGGAGQIRKDVGVWVKTSDWDRRNQRVMRTNAAHMVINDKIRSMMLLMEEAILGGAQDVKAAMRKKAGSQGTLPQRWEGWIAENADRFSADTLLYMRARVKSLKAFAPHCKLREVDRGFMLRYAKWQKAQGYKPNTIADRLDRLRIIVQTLRREEGLSDLSELRRLGFAEEDTGYKRLTPAQITRLEGFTPKQERLRLARDLWLFSFYTAGMRYGDLLRVDRTWIVGKNLEHAGRKKPYTPRIIPLLPKARAILKRYPGKHLWNPIAAGRARSTVSVMLNTAIKEVCLKAGIGAEVARQVSIHWARHSYAEFMWLKGTDLRKIAMLMGLTTATLEKYYLPRWDREAAGEAHTKAFKKS